MLRVAAGLKYPRTAAPAPRGLVDGANDAATRSASGARREVGARAECPLDRGALQLVRDEGRAFRNAQPGGGEVSLLLLSEAVLRFLAESNVMPIASRSPAVVD